MNNLRRNKDIILMKQDRDKGVILLDRHKYPAELLALPSTS